MVLERRWAQEDLLAADGYPNLRGALLRLIDSLEQEIDMSRAASYPEIATVLVPLPRQEPTMGGYAR